MISESDKNDEAIIKVLDKWADAFSFEKPDAIVSMYARDASLWGTLSSRRRDSHELIRDYFEHLFEFKERRVVFDKPRIRYYEDMSVCAGTYLLSWMDGVKKIELPARYSLVLSYQEKNWLIVDHHSSAMPDDQSCPENQNL